jgi:L-threonylcarbamoyladenylate synthase
MSASTAPPPTVPRQADADAIAAAAAALRAGRLVAFPTETVYGLGADATNDAAVAAIFAAKRRPRFNPLIVHVSNTEAAAALAAFDDRTLRLAHRFWPGPLTIVLPRRPDCPVSLLCSAGLDTLAVRVPASAVAAELLRAAGCPVAAPSANPSGRLSPTTAGHVVEALGAEVDMVLDGGPCAVGVESTVVDLCGPQPLLLRAGGVTREALEAEVGPLAVVAAGAYRPRSPGQLSSHYAPERPVRLNVRGVARDEALLAFGPHPLAGAAAIRNLSESGDLVEAAARLFAALRELDRPGVRAIAVMPIPDHGLGAAINDRLRRAAAPRRGEG